MNLLSQLLLLIALPAALYAQLRINELQAVNTSTYADIVDFVDYADWFELYNASAERVDLANYYLTDNLNKPDKWPLPSGAAIAANSYLVVWADQRDAGIGEKHRREYWPWAEFVTKGLHANFKLSGAGEELGLFYIAEGDTVAVDTLHYGRQVADVSWGRRADRAGEWAYFGDPTPGLENATQFSAELQYASAVSFSQSAAFFDIAPSIAIETAVPSAEIYYTTDGAKPVRGAPTSALYDGPISIEKNTVLKARAYEAGKVPGPIKSQAFFVGERDNALPIISYGVDPDAFWDVEKGIYRNSFKQREVPVSIEFFARNRTRSFAVEAGSRIGGLNIWRFAQKPLTVYLRDRYGADALRYPLFSNRNVGTFSQFALRNGGDDWPSTMLRDPLAERIAAGQMANAGLAYRPVSVFINGDYWGIYNLRERFDEQYFFSHFRVSPAQYTHLEWVAVPADSSETADVAEDRFALAAANGQTDAYRNFVEQLKAMETSSSAAFFFAQSELDVDSYIDFLALEEYAVNTSWFHNRELWRTERAGARWQWLLTDLDKGFLVENVDSSLLEDLKRDPIYAQLMQNETFRRRFVQRYTAHLNNTFSRRRLAAIADSLAQVVAPEIPRHAEKWSFQGGIASQTAWRQELDDLTRFFARRAAASLAQIGEFFALSEHSALEVRSNIEGAGDLYINGVRFVDGAESGRYFHDVPLELTAVPRPGYRLLGWDVEPSAEKLTVDLRGDTLLTALFEKSSTSEIPAEIASDLLLTKEGSPYYAAGDIRVRKGALLRVEAGVEIQMPEQSSLYIEGQLEIAGSADEPVRIVPNASAGADKWGALCFVEASDTSTVRHLYLRGASHGADPLEQIAAISALNSHVVLEHIDIAAVDFPIFVRGGSVELQNSLLHADATSDYINVKNGAALVQNNVFVGNDAPDTDAVDYDGVVDGIIRGNLFYHFTGPNSDAIDIGEAARDVFIVGNTIYHMSDKGISVGQRSSVRIENNAILECNMGVAVKDSSRAAIVGNTFYGNALAVACFEKNIGQWGGFAEVKNSILASSSQRAVWVDEYSELSIRYSLSNTDTLFGEGNLLLDAGFKDARRYNLELRADSPAIDAGDPNSPRDLDGSIADIGADFEFDESLWAGEMTRKSVPPVLINEIMYRAHEDFDSGDWFELYNATDASLDLAGWYFTDSDSTNRFEFAESTRLEAGAYWVVARDVERFKALYPEVDAVVGSFVFGLAPEDCIKLYDAQGELVSSTAYRSGFPWPLAANGRGASLSLNANFLFNRHVDNWFGSELKGSPGRANIPLVEGELVGKGLHLMGNGPNPFSSETAIRYIVDEAGEVEMKIFNMAGQLLAVFAQQRTAAGMGEFLWDGRDRKGHRVAAGVYLYTLSFAGEKKSARMLLLR